MDIMGKDMKEYDRRLFTKIVECVRWCLDEGVLYVSLLEEMKSNSDAYIKFMEGKGSGLSFKKDAE